MTTTREQAITALFNKLGAAYAFKTVGRRIRDPEDVADTKRPALYVVEHDYEYHRPGDNLPPIRSLMAWAVVYTSAGSDQSIIPAQEQNNILDAIDTALAPDPWTDGFQTLGGIVYAALIDGTVERDSGDMTGKGMLAIPIKIIFP